MKIKDPNLASVSKTVNPVIYIKGMNGSQAGLSSSMSQRTISVKSNAASVAQRFDPKQKLISQYEENLQQIYGM